MLFIAEPVVGAAAGAGVPKDGYWQRIREICDKYNIKLIVNFTMEGRIEEYEMYVKRDLILIVDY